MRIVIDANVFVSYFLGNLVREKLDRILLDARIVLLASDALLAEIRDVFSRPKFRKHISPAQLEHLLTTLDRRAEKIDTQSNVALARDVKDDFLLVLCREGKADFLISGDSDLLVLGVFEGTSILTLSSFEQIWAMPEQ
ncbi:MAG: putative toxin-antitoxin system toxin component, PIN family [Saprospiraceae bacterium]